MMRSMYSGVSGLKTHQTKMDVIGNNIANVNTVGFKSSSVTFSEIMYQNLSGASGPNALTGTGGVNAKQIGLGVTTGSTSVNITGPGASQTTGRAVSYTHLDVYKRQAMTKVKQKQMPKSRRCKDTCNS